MAKKVLFVVEGGKAENDLIVKTFKRVMKLSNEEVEVIKYRTVLYDLYDRIEGGEYDSLIDYLWVNHKNMFNGEYNKPRDYFSSIYLVFDFDPQDERFSIKKCEWLIEYFSDETRNGKLYFNYPMVESLIDFLDLSQKKFNRRVVSRKNLKGDTYKDRVNRDSLVKKYPRKYSLKNNSFLFILINMHFNKYLFLCDKDDECEVDSMLLFENELSFYHDGKISIINSAILLLCDYNMEIIKNLKIK